MRTLICRRIGLATAVLAVMAAPLAAQSSTAASLPGLRIANVRLFATGSPMVPFDDREYRTVFASGATPLLGVEINIQYNAAQRETSLPVTCTFLRSDGSVFRERTWTATVQSGWTGSYSAGSTGNTEPGYWQPDSYRVTCNVAGLWSNPVDFRIESGQLRNLRGEYLRFFQSSSTLQPREQRTYETTFDADLDWLGLEMSLRYDVPNLALEIPMRCTFTRPGSTFRSERTWTASVQASWSAHFSSATVNMRNTGPWEPGRYRVSCDVGDQRNVTSADFTLRARPVLHDIAICVLEGGVLRNVQAKYNPASSDTTLNGRPFRETYPVDGRYAAGAQWYISNEVITYRDSRYTKYGLPRVLGVDEVAPLVAYRGVQMFGEAGRDEYEIIYVPVRPGCEFQPYQRVVE